MRKAKISFKRTVQDAKKIRIFPFLNPSFPTVTVARTPNTWLIVIIGIFSFWAMWKPDNLSAATPEQLVIVINDSNLESVRLGRYYVKRRGIPRSHLIALDLPNRESITRREFENDLVRPLRRALAEKNLSENTRVIATMFGVPLKIQAPVPTPEEERWKNDAREWQQATLGFLQNIRTQLLTLSELSPSEDPLLPSGIPKTRSDFNQVIQPILTLMSSAQNRLKSQEDSPARRKKNETLIKIKRQLFGQRAHLLSSERSFHFKSPVGLSSSSEGEIQAVTKLLSLLSQVPSDKNREKAYELAQRYFGILGVLALTVDEINKFSFKDADASVDSELSLLWYDFGEYTLSNRLPNPLFAWNPIRSTQLGQDDPLRKFPILMVSRIDAPTAELAKQMVENAISIEHSGLTGKAYIDARGLKAGKELSYGDYDENLRSLADLLKRHTSYPVRIENTDRRYSQPGEAPSVALYAGWYRYRHYEDAFTFNPGAIGYHIASGEALSIHHPDEAGWCKNALERGISVTLGPTNEPYLDSFPKPSDFFGLLLTGQYSLVEAYYLTIRYVSWRMTLFGDPLYNPWKNYPMISFSDLNKTLPSFAGFTHLPPIPSARQLGNPEKALRDRQRDRDAILHQIPALLGR